MGRYAVHLEKYKFKKGNIPHNKGLTYKKTRLNKVHVAKFERLTKDEFDLVTKSPTNKHFAAIPVSTTSARFLRPKAAAKTEVEKRAEDKNKTG